MRPSTTRITWVARAARTIILTLAALARAARVRMMVLAALATQVILVVLGLILAPAQPMLALVCLGYVCLSATGGGLAALIYQKERRLAS